MNKKGPVILRRRLLPSGNTKLYLDIYLDGMPRTQESLKLFLIPEKTQADRQKNQETLDIAEAICAKRLLEVRSGIYGLECAIDRDVLVLPYIRSLIGKKSKEVTEGRVKSLNTVRKYLEAYCREDTTWRSVDKKWCLGFAERLGKGLRMEAPAESTKHHCWCIFRTFIKAAKADGIIRDDPTEGLHPFRHVQAERQFLTEDELKTLAATPLRHDNIRRMFLFSCFTGLRYSDVAGLTWDRVSADGSRITFVQQKTRGLMYLDINSQATALMGERGKPREKVFHPEVTQVHAGRIIIGWAKEAGIGKHITFHCARHTFATLMLDVTDNIALVSKLLGHTNIGTTMIYAKIKDRQKKEAVDKLPKIL